MHKFVIATLAPLLALAATSCERPASQPGAKAETASAEVPNPAMGAPDETAWTIFIQAVGPAEGGGSVFETWASDGDTFQPNAVWPTGDEARNGLDLRPAVIPNVKRRVPGPAADRARADASPAAAGPGDATAATGNTAAATGNIAAAAPAKAATAATAPGPNGEPGSVPPQEEVRRNKPAFDYIVGNKLNALSGLQAAFAANMTVSFPTDSIEVKTNWLPLNLIPQFYPSLTGPIEQNFYVTNDAKGAPHALIAMHVISKQVPNWTWATFEHQLNPGRCDFIGCRDAFGATTPYVAPVDNNGTNQGTVYAACGQTEALQGLLKAANVAAVFNNYCLKGSQTDWIDNAGLSVRMANSVTEWGFVQQGSCMTCHGMANFGPNGQSTTGGGFTNDGNAHIGPIDPTFYWSGGGVSPNPGSSPPIAEGTPGLTRLAVSADFVWSIPFCAYDDSNPSSPQPSNCAAK